MLKVSCSTVVDLNPQPYRIREANLNAATVSALNQCKMTLLTRSKRGHIDGASDRFLNIYFLVQDIHERVSSSHYRYQELAEHFGRSDILFRFKHLLEVQSKACREIATAIRLGNTYQYDDSIMALDELQSSISYLQQQNKPEWRLLLLQLSYLFNNLATVDKQLSNFNNPDANRWRKASLMTPTLTRLRQCGSVSKQISTLTLCCFAMQCACLSH
ncbi:putative efflux (PET) family inner membrane protein YccS [Vibrio ponticus]|nr:putative efflux (PET) family inner membrane protein YccS [Vibrio ponticus]